MNFLISQNDTTAIAIQVHFSDDMICLTLSDGREIKTPIEFYPRLAAASPAELRDFRFIGGGRGIHWEKLNEDLSVDSIIHGRRASNYPVYS
ncbi:MAG: hypothetical protein A3G32_08900 [Deltaproteobacteria bacterium RIFCSPLOWO2_12_FULL_40_28]|nr:MAG: hypothetical protein A3C45_01600 [Deltaproteobacteria bacterium RIFCSPHIGHO2_02_FULL_40_28]OGQ21019.1 MAG: hypothetical protein A3E27_04265 [Deltaproteobacteria bacterium RIFCSPHIGHO2_12_FULL_40_32]OGQ39420.1 MAG: hypothetical protein A3I69_05625 [Deltaproteobacteria bacterium RIFCSPLOWO2_02_FULL_40_36]OGQ54701.1 MAG: hypothetical protein A3G32_08900 [Deltaproteobacteria bacterium RIFCSPLOWO2_12_FULL_40_28]